MSRLLIAALGSSFAAGPGIDPIVDPLARRSGRNYPRLLAALLGADLVDLTVSGATTAHVLDTPQDLGDGVVRPPQLHGVPESADIVTITVGGNDLRFAGAMAAAAWRPFVSASDLAAGFGDALAAGVPHPTSDAVERAATGLAAVVDRARAAAPGARVLLVDYLTVLEESSSDGTPFTRDEFPALLTLQSAVADVFRCAAVRSGAELVLASALEAGHALGSADPWVLPFDRDEVRRFGSFHPNAAGMAAIAAELARVIGRR